MTRVLSAERGAAMVFGLCFAVFLLAIVYYLVGIADAVLFRERVQDAADTAAFSAAVVNARGMNLIALINLVMAAVLAVFVGLRLAQTLCYAGIIVCVALAWPTYSASLDYVPSLARAAANIGKYANQYKKPMKQALSALHTAGKAASVVVPWGSNLRVLDQSAQYGALGVAIPSRVTLPVEDDEFSVLCEHAGEIVGDLALLPISPIVPKRIESKLAQAAGNIVAAGSKWFCDGEGEPPDLNGEDDTELVELPRFSSQEQCDKALETAKQGDGGAALQEDDACTRAVVERLAAMPNRVGEARAGESVCPESCERSDRKECPPRGVPDCDPEQVTRVESAARDVLGYTRVTAGKASPYGRRIELARSQCRPESEHGRDGLVGFWWLERTRTRLYTWQPSLRRWVEDPSVIVAAPARFVQHDEDDPTHPCGRGGTIADGYSDVEGSPLCEGEFVCVSGAAAYDGVPCARVPPPRGAPTTFRERSTEVTAVLRCAYERELPKVNTPPMNINDEVGKDDGKNGQNLKPFRLQRGVYLGGSDFQLRSAVYDDRLPQGAEQVIALSEWGHASDEGKGPEGSALAKSFAAMGRVALGQAEYYFDWTGLDGDLDDETDEGDRTEWLWNLGWRARMRPFRLRQSAADAERTSRNDEPDAEQSKFLPEQAKAHPPGELDCEGLGEGCEQTKQVIDLFGEGDSDEE
jgi:hypothetical protein